MTSAAKGLNVADLLEAPGLASSLRDRLQAADANGDGVISASEMIDVIQSEITATRDRKVMQRVLIALGIACLLIIAAVVGLTYAVVEMSKDTSVQNNVLVSKDGLQPLSTAKLQKTVQLADLYKASSPSELDWLTHVTVPFGKGEAVLKIQNVYLVPGERARFDTAADDVSVEVTADGVTVSGDEQAPGGRRRLMESVDGTASGASVDGLPINGTLLVTELLTELLTYNCTLRAGGQENADAPFQLTVQKPNNTTGFETLFNITVNSCMKISQVRDLIRYTPNFDPQPTSLCFPDDFWKVTLVYRKDEQGHDERLRYDNPWSTLEYYKVKAGSKIALLQGLCGG